MQELIKKGCNRIFILDACRSQLSNNSRALDDSAKGVKNIRDIIPSQFQSSSDGSYLVIRSCSYGQKAQEVPMFDHGLFTYAMLEQLKNSQYITFGSDFLNNLVTRMNKLTSEQSLSAQQPEFIISGELPDLFSNKVTDGSFPDPPIRTVEYVPCPKCSNNNPIGETYTCPKCGKKYFCKTHFSVEHNCCLGCVPPPPPKTGDLRVINLSNVVKLELIWCSPDEFIMGSPTNEAGRNDNEIQHRVKLTKGFWLGKYPVTQEQWQAVMGYNHSKSNIGFNYPVEYVSWDECQEFCQKVSKICPGASLPTEAQWEYACRAGTKTAYYWGNSCDGSQANCDGNFPCGTSHKGPYLGKTTPVGSYPSNAWGFCDMSGNVREWVADWYGSYDGVAGVVDPTGPASGSGRVNRGGSWYSNACICRSAYRDCYDPGYRFNFLGFRLVCAAGPHDY